VEVAAGAMANPTGITQLSLSGTDYSVVVFTARYESCLDFPLELHQKNNDGLISCAKVCRVRRWGEGGDTPSPPPSPGPGCGPGHGRGPCGPHSGPHTAGGWHLFGYQCRVWGQQQALPHAPAPTPGCHLPRRRHPRSPARPWGGLPWCG
jgi:hypothetical protein